jgi:hypothetical protein
LTLYVVVAVAVAVVAANPFDCRGTHNVITMIKVIHLYVFWVL